MHAKVARHSFSDGGPDSQLNELRLAGQCRREVVTAIAVHPLPLNLGYHGFWMRKFRVPVTFSRRTSICQLPAGAEPVGNVPVVESARL